MKGKRLIKYYLKAPSKLFIRVGRNSFLRLLSDEKYLKLLFKSKLGYPLNLDNPQTFNEKLNWLKIHDRNPLYTTMVDKFEAKKYVASIIGDEYIIPTLGVWDRFEGIDFDKLPEQFVLKCTHGSGGSVIVRDKSKLNVEFARKELNRSLKTNYYLLGREWPYKNVIPRIIAEKYIEDENGELNDYKFFCFGGKARFFKIDFDRFIEHHANYYDVDGNLLPFGESAYPPIPTRNLTIPKNLKKMIELAEKLSQGMRFLRVDLFEIKGQIFFGELTFYPISGCGKYTDEKWDKKIGDMLDIS